MPYINRVRITNIKYNDGNNYYEDFKVKLGGAHTLIDMINGLGKTFFLQCMAQPMLPNAKFKQEFPIALLFDNKNNNSSIHALVEWRLDDGSPFRYALIGWCAYKKEKSEQNSFLDADENGEFGTLLYITYYNEPNAYDIEGIPLLTQREDGTKKVMHYKELEKYLKMLQQMPLRDYDVTINRTRREHLKALAKLNINSVEWKHLMGINASEANAEKYLRSYSTASSFIQDFLIPTIEESYHLRHEGDYQTEDVRAKTLLQLRQTLLTLQQKESLEAEYHYIEAACERIYDQLGVLEQSFKSKTTLIEQLSEMHQGLGQNKCLSEAKKQQILQEIQELERLLAQHRQRIDSLNRLENACHIKEAEDRLQQLSYLVQEAKMLFSQKEEDLKKIKAQQVYYEAEKLYREYTIHKMKKTLKEEVLSTRAKEHEELMADYNYWGNVYGNRLLKQLETSRISKETVENNLETLTQSYHTCCLETARLKAVIGHHQEGILIKEAERDALKGQLSHLQKQFHHLTKEQLFEALTLKQETYDALKKTQTQTCEVLLEVEGLHVQALNEQKLLCMENTHHQEKVIDLQQRIEAVEEAKTQIHVLEKQYHTYELDAYLKKGIEKLQKSMAQKIAEKKEKEERLGAIEENRGIVLSPCAKRQFNRVSHTYPSAILGYTFLQNHSMEEKVALLEQTPLLPYSILVDQVDFRKLVTDTQLRRSLEDEVMPIINRDALGKGQKLEVEDITFTIKDIAYFIDGDLKEKEIRRLKKEMLALSQEIHDLEAQAITLSKHYALVLEVTRNYPEEIIQGYVNQLESASRKAETLARKAQEQVVQIENLDLQARQLKQDQATQSQVLKSLAEEVARLQSEWEALSVWAEQNKVKQTLETDLTDLLGILAEEKATLEALHVHKETLYHQQQVLEAKKEGIVAAFYEINIEMKQFTFEVVEDAKYALSDISHEEAKLKYEVYDQRLREEAGDVKLLEQSIKECTDAMAIKEMEMAAKGEAFAPSYFKEKDLLQGDYMPFLKQLERQMAKCLAECDVVREQVDTHKMNHANQAGTVTAMKRQFVKDYGMRYEEVTLEEGILSDCLIKLKDEKAYLLGAINQIQKQQRDRQKQESELNQHLLTLGVQIDKLNALMYKYQLQYQPQVQGIRSMECFESLEKATQQVIGTLQQGCITYNQLLKEVLDYLESPELVHFKGDLDRLLLESPQDEATCNVYQRLIGEEGGYLENIREEKVRIKTTILELKKDEESFITQCIQKCEQVYNDLMSLAHISQIELYGRTQEMIRIVVTPLEEDLRFAKMRNYINGLVEQVEHIEENRKQAFLAGRLTLRELFSAFVVNMKKSDVRVYKVEYLQENSRELPWSHAIGSTGQSNGMYMSLFICLISYIRKLYNPHVGEDSRKLIMLDSPFSGTAAAYIWEPVIKLLDRNNVQLLCVGYDIPQHLMSLFDVKYNIGSTYDQHKKQTIVVENIKSHINLERLSYDKLLGEQIRL